MAKLTQRLGFTRYEADEYYQQALDAFQKRRFNEAYDAISQAIVLLPTKSEYYAARGLFHLEDDEQKEALEDFEKSLKHNRYEMLAHYGRGMIAYKDGNWDEALAHFNTAYLAAQNRGEALYYTALVQHRKGNNTAAVNSMTMAAERFEAAGDKRASQAKQWIKTFEKLVKEAEQAAAAAAKASAAKTPALQGVPAASQLALPSGADEDES
jgi:tetratricopeptide (TPR) repeat protein